MGIIIIVVTYRRDIKSLLMSLLNPNPVYNNVRITPL